MTNITVHNATIVQGDSINWLIGLTVLPGYTFDFTQFTYAFACERTYGSQGVYGGGNSGTQQTFGANVLATNWSYDSTLPIGQTRFLLTQAQTSGLQPGTYDYQIKAKTGAAGQTYTILSGSIKVLVSPVPTF